MTPGRGGRAVWPRSRRYNQLVSTPRPWPEYPPELAWAFEGFDEQLDTTTRTTHDLETRAVELRTEAAATEIRGFSEACLRMAERYEAAAAARLAAS